MGIKPKVGLPSKAQLTALGDAMMDTRAVLGNVSRALDALYGAAATNEERAIAMAAKRDVERALKHWDTDE